MYINYKIKTMNKKKMFMKLDIIKFNAFANL